MKKLLLSFITLLTWTSASTQALHDQQEKIEQASHALAPAILTFQRHIITEDLQHSIDQLIAAANDPYKKFVVAGLIYNMDTARSFQLHEAAYNADPAGNHFLLEYAIEQHRRGNYAQAAALYEKYAPTAPEDLRITIWLADCYINTSQPEKAMTAWKQADFRNNQRFINKAIHTIYGRTDQFQQRDSWRKELAAGKTSPAYPLIFQDTNWELDWWENMVMDSFLTADLELVQKSGLPVKDVDVLQGYADLKLLPEINRDAMTGMLTINHLILGTDPLPVNGKLTNNLLSTCFALGLVNEDVFFENRGKELPGLAHKKKDVAFLLLYITLETAVKGKASPEILLDGWKKFHDEQCAISYLYSIRKTLKYDSPELAQAIKEFPDAAMLYWAKASAANNEGKPGIKDLLIKTIQQEFKSLKSDGRQSATRLNEYFSYLGEAK